MKAALALLALLLLAVPVASQAPGEHVLQYTAFVHTSQTATGIVPQTVVVVDDAHTWTGGNGTSMLEVRVSYVVNSGAAVNPTADFAALWDGVAVANCAWRVEGGTITGGRFNPLVSLFCELPSFVLPGNHTIEVQRTAVTGTPVSNAVTSIILHQTETVTMDIDVNTEIDFFVPFLFWGGLALFFLMRRSFFPAVASTVMVLSALLAAPLWSFALGIMLILLGVWIEAIARAGVFKAAGEA